MNNPNLTVTPVIPIPGLPASQLRMSNKSSKKTPKKAKDLQRSDFMIARSTYSPQTKSNDSENEDDSDDDDLFGQNELNSQVMVNGNKRPLQSPEQNDQRNVRTKSTQK